MAHDYEKKWRSKDVLVLDNVDFSSMLLCDRVLAGLTKTGFKKPSPIQLEAIPTGRFGKDLLVQAKSGTGKTLVFVIVALEMLHRKIFRPQVLILVPTREIATQICSVVKSVGSYFPKLTCESFIGGFPVADDVKKAHNCQIVVGTPGRLKQLIEMKALSTNSIRLAVFDEADEVLSISWLEDIDFIFNSLPEDKQVIATSATYPPKLKKIVIKYLRDPYLAQIDTRRLALLGIIHYIKVVESSAMPIKQYRLKLAALEPILKNIKFTQCLVYCNGIHKVETLYRDIKKWGFSTTYISSNRDQAERLKAIDCLKRFKCKVLVSSNVTARGIDAENVDLVINFDVSNYTETYLHRSGRAGRYGTKGATISICDLFEMKFIERIEKEAHFKSYELPDPVPTDLIQNPVLDNYAIEATNILENSNGVSEEQPVSTNRYNCPEENNFEQCGNQSNNVSTTIAEVNEGSSATIAEVNKGSSATIAEVNKGSSAPIADVNDGKFEELNKVSILDHEGTSSFTKKNFENNLLSDIELQSNLKNCIITEKSDDNNTYVRIVDKLDGKKSENFSKEDLNTLNLSGQKILEDFKSNIYVSAIKNGITNALSDFKNAKSLDTSNDTVETNVIVNECCDKENVESLISGNNNLVEDEENSDVINVKESALVSSECNILEVANIKDNEEKSCDMNVIESPLLSTSEEIVEIFSKVDNLCSQSNNSEVARTKDSENSLASLNENSCHINDKCSTLLTNEPGAEICVEQDSPSNPQTNEVQSMNNLGKNEINIAVENFAEKYENMELSVLRNNKNSLDFNNTTAENSVCNNISLIHIQDLNSRRCDYYYNVFKLFKKGNSSEQSESVKEALNKEDSFIKKESCIQEPILDTELNSVEKPSTTLIIFNEAASKNADELKFESSLQVPNTLELEMASGNNDDNITNFHVPPCYESTPHFEKNKHVTCLLDKGATEPPGRNMSFFDKVSGESASETESYHENNDLNNDLSSHFLSDSESDSDSFNDGSSSSRSISSSDYDDDDSCDQVSTETSSSESHSSVDSLSVHSIEYSCRKGAKSLEKPHPNVFKQEKAPLKKHQQINHSKCSNIRHQYHSKTHQNPSHSNDFFNNLHQPALGDYSNAYDKRNQFNYSKVHQASSNGQHFHSKKMKNMHKNRNNFQFSCNGQHSSACFMPSEHRCHSYHDNISCNQRAICDQWYKIFCYQWQHIQNSCNINF